jgi:hypothetical protein
MGRRTLALALVLSLVVLSGCVMPVGGTIRAPIVKTQSALMLGDTSVGYSKVGESMAEGIVLIAQGDASITAAMEDGGIRRIHHVDSEEISILGVYCKQIIRVYGE